jgi:hypothetical protein
MKFVIARTARDRPSLMHKLSEEYEYLTSCGVDVTGWSRAYLAEPIPEVLCKRCGAILAVMGEGVVPKTRTRILHIVS